MKKLASLLFVGVLFLGGCSSSDNSVTCTLEQDNEKLEYVFDYDGDKNLTGFNMITDMTSDEAFTQDDLDKMDAVFKLSTSMVDGVDYTMTHDEKTMKSIAIKITVDIEKYDAETDALGFMNTFGGSEKDIKKMKVSKIVKTIEGEGAKCGEVK